MLNSIRLAPVLVVACMSAGLCAAPAAEPEVAGVKVNRIDTASSAPLDVTLLDKWKLRVVVGPSPEQLATKIAMELPVSGRGAWPAADVEVRDADGRAVAVDHNGIAWHEFVLTAASEGSRFTVQAVTPARKGPTIFPPAAQTAVNSQIGLEARICKWYDGRSAALCVRFDDSHPTHLSTAIPILREYGFRATFMINPGDRDGRSPNSRWRSPFIEHLEKWRDVARQGDQEFGNHTLHHRGATNDTDMEHEVGDASKVIWELFPKRSKLVALNLGGGTRWITTKTLRYYLDRYHLFEVTGSLGMDDVYGNRVAAFRQHLERNLQSDGLGWCKVHFHSIGPKLASSEEHFRAVLDIVKEHADRLWITGLADAYKYLTERRGAQLKLTSDDDHRASLAVTCTTDLELFDQPLTIDLVLPDNWQTSRLRVFDPTGEPVTTRGLPNATRRVRLHVPPITASYRIECSGREDAEE